MRKIPILTLIILAALAVLNTAAYQSDDGLISVNPIEYDAKTTAKMDGQVVDVYVYSKNVKLKINTSLKEIHVEIYVFGVNNFGCQIKSFIAAQTDFIQAFVEQVYCNRRK